MVNRGLLTIIVNPQYLMSFDFTDTTYHPGSTTYQQVDGKTAIILTLTAPASGQVDAPWANVNWVYANKPAVANAMFTRFQQIYEASSGPAVSFVFSCKVKRLQAGTKFQLGIYGDLVFEYGGNSTYHFLVPNWEWTGDPNNCIASSTPYLNSQTMGFQIIDNTARPSLRFTITPMGRTLTGVKLYFRPQFILRANGPEWGANASGGTESVAITDMSIREL